MAARLLDRLSTAIELAALGAAGAIVLTGGWQGMIGPWHLSARDASRALLVFSTFFLVRSLTNRPGWETRALAWSYDPWKGKTGGGLLRAAVGCVAAWGAAGAALGLGEVAGLRVSHPDLFPDWGAAACVLAGAGVLYGTCFAALAPPAFAVAAIPRAARHSPERAGRLGLAFFPLAATCLLAGERSIWSLPPSAAGALRIAPGLAVLLALPVFGWLACRVAPQFLTGARSTVVVSALAAVLLCVAATLWFGRGRSEPSPITRIAANGGRTNLLLITIDTLRADRLGCYGSSVRTPHIDALAASGVRFADAVCSIPETGPSHTSILSGRYPVAHGARANGQQPLDLPGFPEVLRDEGYRTGAIVSGYTLKRGLSGTDRGFSSYDDSFSAWAGLSGLQLTAWLERRGAISYVTLWKLWAERRGDDTTDRAIRWLDANAVADAPFFLWVHYFDPHGPYDAPAPWNRMYYSGNERDPANHSMDGVAILHAHQRKPGVTDVGFYVASYEGEVSWADSQVGRLLERLDARGLRGSTLVVLTADHGESLTEHGYHFAHGGDLFEPSVRVPLIVSGPGVAPGQVSPLPARSVDIAPTILESLSGGAGAMKNLGEIDGSSLVAELRAPGSEAGGARAALIEGEVTRERGGMRYDDPVEGKLYAIRDCARKLVRTPGQADALYDLDADPGELSDVASVQPALTKEMGDRLAAWLRARSAEAPSRTLTDEEKAILESLGYAGR